MSLQNGRYTAASPPASPRGGAWNGSPRRSRLFGANGLRTGPDGRIYVAQVTGSQISALDIGTGQLETISPMGGDIVAPDDVAFDPRGNLYVTEVMDGRVSVRGVDGRTRVLRDDVPGANGITFHQGRLFVDECRIGGRLLELDLNGGAPRVLLENVPMPNAMEVGPDGLLYFPVMGANEIWRDPSRRRRGRARGRRPRRPGRRQVRFQGLHRLDAGADRRGAAHRSAHRRPHRAGRLDPGLDNLTFVGDRLFVSHLTDGRITEILGGGKTRTLLPGGLNWPLDLAMGDDGQLYVADGTALLRRSRPGASCSPSGCSSRPGYPGYLRGLAPRGARCFAVTTSDGQVARYRPWENASEVLADGLDQLYGVAVAPGGAIVVAELGTGRVLSIQSGKVEVLASGLRDPMGVAIGPDGACLVSEAGAGRVVKLTAAGVETVLDGLQRPQGILVREGQLYIVDAGAKALIAFDLESKARRTHRRRPAGRRPARRDVPKPLRGLPPFSGPQGPFAGIAAGPDGTLYVSADAEGSVLALRPG